MKAVAWEKTRATMNRPTGQMAYALARYSQLDQAGLVAMARHGRGSDHASRIRRRPDATERALYLRRSDDGGGFVCELPDAYVAPPAADLVQQHERHLKRKGASLRKGAAVAMHLQLGVSPEWFGAARFNTRSDIVQQMTQLAAEFVETHLGGVFSARYDVDEESGGGVVDVFAAPVHRNARSGHAVVSCRKSVQALGRASGHPGKPLRGLQDLWHKTCTTRLDRDIRARRACRRNTGRPFGRLGI